MWIYQKPLSGDNLLALKKVEEKFRSFSGPKSIASAFIEDATLVSDFEAEENVAEIVRNLSPIIETNFKVKVDLEDYLAFIVKYTGSLDEEDDLTYHVDESHITIDICIGDEWAGGELCFDTYLEVIDVTQQPGYVTIFQGDTPHCACPVWDGTRINLVIWCRRVQDCPRKFYEEYLEYLAHANLDPKIAPVGFTVPSLHASRGARSSNGLRLEDIPRDIIIQIFKQLTYKEWCCITATSKYWHMFMSNPSVMDLLLKLNYYTKCTRNTEEVKRYCCRKYWGTPVIGEKEYTFLHIGGAGVRIGDSIWNHISINDEQKSKATSMFFRTFDKSFKARGIFVDTDESVFDTLTASFYDRNMFISDKETNMSLRERVEDCVRKILEEISCSGGFFLSHSLGGYLGSSLTGQILEDLRLCSTSPRLCFSVLPSQNTRHVLPGIKLLNEYSCANILFSNESMMNVVKNYSDNPDFVDCNALVARVAETITEPMRHEGVLNNSISDLTIYQVPHYTVNMLSCSFSPIGIDNTSNATQLAANAYERSSMLVPYSSEDGKFISTALYFRGDVVPKDVMSAIGYLKTRRNIQFTSGFFGGMRCGSVYNPAKYFNRSQEIVTAEKCVTVLSNHTGYSSLLSKIVNEHETTNEEDNELIEYGKSVIKDYQEIDDETI